MGSSFEPLTSEEIDDIVDWQLDDGRRRGQYGVPCAVGEPGTWPLATWFIRSGVTLLSLPERLAASRGRDFLARLCGGRR